MRLAKVQDRIDVIRNLDSAAVLAADINAYKTHLKKRKQFVDTEARLKDLENAVNIQNKLLEMLISKLQLNNTNHDAVGS